MARALIIGIGNPLRGDDGLGWHAVEKLSELFWREEAETLICHQLTPELAETVARASRVIFIDAHIGSPAGMIRVNRLTSASPPDWPLTHCLDPQALLQYCHAIYQTWPEAWAISMAGASYDYSEALSAPVKSQLPLLVGLATEAVLQGSAWPLKGSAASANVAAPST
jgi:hydrogenase maturation protease